MLCQSQIIQVRERISGKKIDTFIQLLVVDGVGPKETPRCDMSQGLRELAIRGAALFCCGMNHRVYSAVDSRRFQTSDEFHGAIIPRPKRQTKSDGFIFGVLLI